MKAAFHRRGSRRGGWIWILLLFTVSFSAAGRDLINIDFGAGPATPKSGPAAVGNSAGDFWNYYERRTVSGTFIGSGTLFDLRTADGRSTGGASVGVANAPGAWGNGTADPMFSGYLYSFDGEDIVLHLAWLPPGVHDFYLYGHGGPGVNEANSVFTLTSGTRNYGSLSTTTGPGWTSPAWQEGMQYVVFRNVAVAAADTVVVRVSRGGHSQPALSGMQIESQLPDPPRIDREPPTESAVEVGSTAAISVAASGGQPLRYQWYKEVPPSAGQSEGTLFMVHGATSATLVIPSAAPGDEAYYRVGVANTDGSVWSRRAFLDVLPPPPPQILGTPPPRTVVEGSDVTIPVEVVSSTAVTYLWTRDGVSIAGAHSPVLRLPDVSLADAGEYRLEARNAGGSVQTDGIRVIVMPRAAPVIVKQPVGGLAEIGGRFEFSVEVFSVLPARFQWFKDGAAVSGGTGSTLNILAFRQADEGLYRVVISNEGGNVVSAEVRVTLIVATPVIGFQPQNVTVEVGGVATFRVSAGPAVPLTYVWFKGDAPIPCTMGTSTHSRGMISGRRSVD